MLRHVTDANHVNSQAAYAFILGVLRRKGIKWKRQTCCVWPDLWQSQVTLGSNFSTSSERFRPGLSIACWIFPPRLLVTEIDGAATPPPAEGRARTRSRVIIFRNIDVTAVHTGPAGRQATLTYDRPGRNTYTELSHLAVLTLSTPQSCSLCSPAIAVSKSYTWNSLLVHSPNDTVNHVWGKPGSATWPNMRPPLTLPSIGGVCHCLGHRPGLTVGTYWGVSRCGPYNCIYLLNYFVLSSSAYTVRCRTLARLDRCQKFYLRYCYFF